jgi:hypothetical protein
LPSQQELKVSAQLSTPGSPSRCEHRIAGYATLGPHIILERWFWTVYFQSGQAC